MYTDHQISATKVLIVKTSSLGDIIQSFGVLDYLKEQIPNVQIDWAVDASLASIVSVHPLIRNTIPLHIKKPTFKDLTALRKEKYDVVFDLQKNTKSGIITALTRSPLKVGFGFKTCREWPNILFTNRRYNISTDLNIREQYVGLVKEFRKSGAGTQTGTGTKIGGGVRFKIGEEGCRKIGEILLGSKKRIMVCPGSKWKNKQLPVETFTELLQLIEKEVEASFFLMWGDAAEKADCETMQKGLGNAKIVDKLALPVWQNLMAEMDLLIAVDSSALHLCGTTATPTFSIFGPTAPTIFKPIGDHHFAVQGPCPYNKTFEKQCSVLRTCPTGACIRNLSASDLFRQFFRWHQSVTD